MNRISRKVTQFLSYIHSLLKSSLRVGVGVAFLSATGYSVGDLTLFGASRSFHPSIVLVANANIPLVISLIFALVWPPKIRFPARYYFVIFFSGFLHTVGQVMTSFANMLIGPGNSAALYYTMPIFSVIFSYLFLNYELKKNQVVSTASTTLGVFFITRSSSVQMTSTSVNGYWVVFGIFAGLLGAASHAGSLTIRGKLQDSDIGSSVFVGSFLLQYSISSIIYYAFSGAWTKPCINRIDLVMLVVCGFPCFFATLCMYIAVSLENPPTVSIILTTGVFLVNAGQKILFPYIPFGWMSIAGAILIFFSCVLVASVDQRESNNGNGIVNEDERRPFVNE